MKCLAHGLTESVTEYQLPTFPSEVLQSVKFCLAKYTEASDSLLDSSLQEKRVQKNAFQPRCNLEETKFNSF